ncbi:hypothetical protein ACIBI8_23200 [Streptomyces sp. NPDC050529]|uniref:hypothetical protein n=1 Tax=unclassified Streptomyces TaxID=2593676 RepID=UPI002DD9E739|nr:hypothetical protein [Streptomyces sp. NBC_01022]WRZ79549.1 hypothetical protein OG316_04370 [Streptomyces sp. NBC_01022]
MPQIGRHLRSLRFALGLAQTNFTACLETGASALWHALTADKVTLCGIPQHQVTFYRHLLVAKGSGTCSGCRAKAVDVSSGP